MFKEHRDYNRAGDFLFLAVLSLPDFSLCLSSSSAISCTLRSSTDNCGHSGCGISDFQSSSQCYPK